MNQVQRGVYIIICFRDAERYQRRIQLASLLKAFSMLLNESDLARVNVIIAEQTHGLKFNRGLLFNAAVEHIDKKEHNGSEWDIILHDADLLPSMSYMRAHYLPTYFTSSISHLGSSWVGRYHNNKNYFGGVLRMAIPIYIKTGGFSNSYYGWGGEDDDYLWRVIRSGIAIERQSHSLTAYTDMEGRSLANKLSWLKEDRRTRMCNNKWELRKTAHRRMSDTRDRYSQSNCESAYEIVSTLTSATPNASWTFLLIRPTCI